MPPPTGARRPESAVSACARLVANDQTRRDSSDCKRSRKVRDRGDAQFRGRRRGRCEDVGDVLDQRAVRGVADAGHDGDAGGEHRAHDPFVVERGEVVARAAATGEDDDVDIGFVAAALAAPRTMLSAAPSPCTCAGDKHQSRPAGSAGQRR